MLVEKSSYFQARTVHRSTMCADLGLQFSRPRESIGSDGTIFGIPASSLIAAGVDLNTIRELLGHSDYQMTLRYAHLAPEHKLMAVAKLVRAGI